MNKFFVLFFLFNLQAVAQTEIYPPNWFVGLTDTTLQLIIKQKDIGLTISSITTSDKNVSVLSVSKTKHKDYILVNCAIGTQTKPGKFQLQLAGKKKQTIPYELTQKQAIPQTLQGNDLIYLVMPDRFANGNTQNDIDVTKREKTMFRDSMYARHGGDLQGITQHINYIKDLGATTLWLTPFQENNEPSQSYHGYAITNHYKVDSRFGTLADYTQLCAEAKKQNMKWVLDLVFNHIGDGHWLYTDNPFDSVIHEFKNFTRTNYRANTLMDPYASELDKKIFTEGWFDHHMPDVNNDNPIVAKYMTQNTIWWIETSGADGIRIDTYSYPEQKFMQAWYQHIIAEYPTLSVFGEIWEHAVPLQSYFVPKDKNSRQNMQNVLDFQFCFAIDDAVSKTDGWTEGVSKLYYNLSQDFVYADPYHHIIFTDNHDLDRFYSTINYDLNKWKSAMSIMMTIRGIPSVFYGTEILMRNKGEHGVIREDFKGGWKEDSINKFTKLGRTMDENESWNHLQFLAKWRKSTTAMSGKMKQFIPEKGVYVYFRYSDTQKIMVVYNSSNSAVSVSLDRFDEILNGNQLLVNIFTQEKITIGHSLKAKAGETVIFEVK